MATRQGWITKQGGRIKSWKKRWCILDETALHYYKTEGGPKQGDIPIKSFGSVRAAHSSKNHSFKIVTNHREYMFSCDDENDMRAWIEALSLARMKVKGSETSFEGNFKKIGESDFEKLRVVGQGSFGKVLQVRHKKTGQIYAMKVLNKKTVVERDDVKSIQTEKSILMKLSSPFLVKLHSSFQTADKLYFVMDYINGGELFHHLQAERAFAPIRARFYTAEIVLGLEYLHKRGIIYRDLKPENILITADGHVCLTDFGISKEGLSCKSARTATFCGTPEYLAPEVLLGQEYGQEIDWWSLGTILYEMLTSTPPFYSEDVQLMYQKILNDTIDFEEIPDKNTQGIILAFLERDPAKRLTEPARIKAHPYFSSIDWAKLEKREVQPPFVPPVKDKTDASQFDEEFTKMPVHSLVQGSELSKQIQEQFRGFSYYGESLVATPTDAPVLVDGKEH